MSVVEQAGLRGVPGVAERPSKQDFRLVPGALIVWAVTIAGLHWAWPGAVAVAAPVTLAALALVVTRYRRRLGAGAAVVAALGIAAAVVVGVRTAEVADHPVRAAALRSTQAGLTVTVADLPHVLNTSGYAGRAGGPTRVLVPADLIHASIGGTELACRGRVLLLADASSYAELLPGQRIRVTGQLAPAQSDPLTVAVLRVRGPPVAVAPAPWWQRLAARVRDGLRVAAGALDEESAGLLPGLVTGDTSRMPPRIVTEFQIAGLTHLNAVSGANVAIMCGTVLLLARVGGAGPRLTAVIAGLVLLGFVVIVGPQPSVLRAALMGGISLLGLATGRTRAALPSLAASVIVLVLLDSTLATSLGYALSVVATAALVLIAPGWVRRLRSRGVPAGLAESLAVPTAAHLVTAPLIAGFSGQVSLVAIPANMLAEPVVAPVTVLGVLAMIVAPLHHGIATVFVELAGPLVRWLIIVARQAAAVPDAVLPWPTGLPGALILTGVSVALIAALRVRRLRVALIAALAGLFVVWLPVRVIRPSWPVAGWAMVSCDVGQGDAEVLATAEPGRAVVVDTGPEPLAVDECLRSLGVSHIPLVVLSHLHADHIGGLAAVLAHRSVGAVALGSSRVPAWAYEKVRKETAMAHVPLVALAVGQRLSWPGLALDVLGTHAARDEADLPDPDGTTVNNTSVVLRANTSAGRVLLTGDVELAAQAELLNAGADLRADVLKVPHHGSRYSVPDFLAAVHARIALVSVGAGNRYGHPSPLTLGELRALGAAVARTDEDGAVAMVAGADGPALVRSGRPRAPPKH